MKQIVRAPSRTSSATTSAASASTERRTPSASSVSGGFHIATVLRAPGEPSSSISAKSVAPGQALGELDRVGDRRRRQQEAEVVRRAAAAAGAARWRRASRRRRGRRAPRRPRPRAGCARNAAPRLVVGQDPHVQHVRVGEDQVRVAPDRRARLARRVAVVDRRAAGRAAAARASARAWSCASALVGYRYSARASGSRHSWSSTGRLKASDLPDAVPVVTTTSDVGRRRERRRLVRPQLVHAARAQRLGDRRVQVVWERRSARLARACTAVVATSRSSSRPAASSASQGSTSRTDAHARSDTRTVVRTFHHSRFPAPRGRRRCPSSSPRATARRRSGRSSRRCGPAPRRRARCWSWTPTRPTGRPTVARARGRRRSSPRTRCCPSSARRAARATRCGARSASAAATSSSSSTATPASFGAHFVTGTLGPLLDEPGVEFVKACFRRPFGDDARGRRPRDRADGAPAAAPLLAGARRPAPAAGGRDGRAPRPALPAALLHGYAVETALLLDVHAAVGAARASPQVDLDVRLNDHQPLRALGAMADEVLAAAVRAHPGPRRRAAPRRAPADGREC